MTCSIFGLDITWFCCISSTSTLNMLNCSKFIKDVFTFWIVFWIWLNPNGWNQLWSNNTYCLSYTANATPADELATLGASASAGMVLTPKPEIFRLQHQKSLRFPPFQRIPEEHPSGGWRHQRHSETPGGVLWQRWPDGLCPHVWSWHDKLGWETTDLLQLVYSEGFLQDLLMY